MKKKTFFSSKKMTADLRMVLLQSVQSSLLHATRTGRPQQLYNVHWLVEGN